MLEFPNKITKKKENQSLIKVILNKFLHFSNVIFTGQKYMYEL